jgi:hypothetical protein
MRIGAMIALALLVLFTLPAFAVQRMVLIEEFTNTG